MLDIALMPLSLEPKTFNAGDTVRITVSFQYKAGKDTILQLLAAPYYTNVLGQHLVDTCVGQAELLLKATSTTVGKTATVDMTLLPQSLGGIENGVYGLVVWLRQGESLAGPWLLPAPFARAEQDNVLVVSGNNGGSDFMSSMMPMVMLLMMLGMVGPMMGGGSE